jgi:Helix-turn-helix domain
MGHGMTADLTAGLRALAEALPAGTAVPVPRELLLELLGSNGAAVQTSATPPADLTVADLCREFTRKPSAVRAWLERGDFPGAYKLQGRDWRVPAAGVEAYRSRQQQGGKQAPAPGARDPGAWRRVRPMGTSGGRQS